MAVKDLSALGVLYTDRRDFYISPNEVRELWPEITPFTTIISNRGTKKVQDPDFKLFEHRSGFINQRFVYNDATPSAWPVTGLPGEQIAGITVDGILGLPASADDSYKGLLLEVYATNGTTYKGVVLVISVQSATSITIKAMGNPRATNNSVSALADNDIFMVMGTAFGEGQTAPDAASDDLEVVYNSCEIFRTSIEITGTLYEAALRGYSRELERLRVEKNKEHKFQKEQAFLRGVRLGGTGMTDLAANNSTADAFQAHTTDVDGKTVRTTMGLIPSIYRYGATSGDQQNIFTLSAATYSYAQFVDDTEKVFQYLPEDGSKIALCGAGALGFWSKVDATAAGFIKNSGFSVQINSMQKSSLGFNFRELLTPHGMIKLVFAPALRGPYRNSMVVIEPADLQFVQYRAPKFRANIKTDNGYDGVKDEYMSDEGIGMTLIEKHSLWNITA